MTIETVIFDMDGVLVDSEPYWAQARRDFANAHGLTWTDADQRQAMGQSSTGWATLMRDRLQLTDPIEHIIQQMQTRVRAMYEQRIPLRPGAKAAVELAAAHYRVGLASGSPTSIIQRVIRQTELEPLFETVVYGDTVERGKPAPDIYLEALRRLNMRPATAVGIEDTAHGIHALKAAGMFAIAAPSPAFPLSDDILALADVHIASMQHITLAVFNQLAR